MAIKQAVLDELRVRRSRNRRNAIQLLEAEIEELRTQIEEKVKINYEKHIVYSP